MVHLNRWLSRFVVECRRQDGNPSSICNIIAGLYRYSRKSASEGGSCPNFMNRKDTLFRDLNGAIQVRLRELREKAVVKHASVVVGVPSHR